MKEHQSQKKQSSKINISEKIKNQRNTSAQYYKEVRQHVDAQKQKLKDFQKQSTEKVKHIYRKSAEQYNKFQEVDITVPVDGEVERGTRIFTAHCAKCHSIEVSGTYSNKKGPSLGLIYNKKVGSDINFIGYSDAMMKSNLYWGAKNLYKFIENPQLFFPGTHCKFGDQVKVNGLRSQEDRADLITFFREYTQQLSKNLVLRQIRQKSYGQYQTEIYAKQQEKAQKRRYQRQS